MKKQKKVNGEILWVTANCVGYKCDCGEETVVDTEIYTGRHNTCSKCGKKYKLRQTNTVYQVEND